MTQVTYKDTARFNGWTNYETWNVVLWLNNDEELYKIARLCKNYNGFIKHIRKHFPYTYAVAGTADGVRFDDSRVNGAEINACLPSLFDQY